MPIAPIAARKVLTEFIAELESSLALTDPCMSALRMIYNYARFDLVRLLS